MAPESIPRAGDDGHLGYTAWAMSGRKPHKLDLYRLAVQHPQAEVLFMLRAYAHYARRDAGHRPSHFQGRLREDFAGTAALATTWVAMDEGHRALALESDYRTVRWSLWRAERELGPRRHDLHLIYADVMAIDRPVAPPVDIVAALNFSTFIYHERLGLKAYFRLARRCLAPGGLLVVDAFGGPGTEGPALQRRRVTPPAHEGMRPFTYVWEQRAFDPVTRRIDCRIHFEYPGQKALKNAFHYDWRLWTLAELREVMIEAGLAPVEVWHRRRPGDLRYQPVRHLAGGEDYVAYVIGRRGPVGTGRPGTPSQRLQSVPAGG